ncbi:MAG: amidohydrolase family protein [Promethearchaeota archaeon]
MDKPILIKNVLLIDPSQKMQAERKDISIIDGKIVEKIEAENNEIREIDGSNLVAIPAAIDLRSFFYTPLINYIRAKSMKLEGRNFDSDIIVIPSLLNVEREYIRHGYTFIVEQEVGFTQIDVVKANIEFTSVLDKAIVLEIGSHWPLNAEYNEEMDVNSAVQRIGVYVNEMLRKLNAFSISATAPFHQQFWSIAKEIDLKFEKVPLFSISPKTVYERIGRAVLEGKTGIDSDIFISPYFIEVVERERDLYSLLDELLNKLSDITDELKDKSNNSPAIHLSLGNHYFIENPDLAIKLLKDHNNFRINVAPIVFKGTRPLITQHRNLVQNKIKNILNQVQTQTQTQNQTQDALNVVDLELDTEYYITTLDYKSENERNLHAKILYSFLYIIKSAKKENLLHKISLTTNSPINMCPIDISDVFAMLINDSELKKIKEFLISAGIDKSKIDSEILNTNLDFYDIVQLISNSPAIALGLQNKKGTLKANADADLVLFEMSNNELSSIKSMSAEELKKKILIPSIVIKAGNIVFENGQFDERAIKMKLGKLFSVEKFIDNNQKDQILKKKEEFFKKYFSMKYELKE